MQNVNRLINVLLIVFVIFGLLLYDALVRTDLPVYENITLNVAANNGSPYGPITIQSVRTFIRNKTCHKINLDDDHVTNEKKMAVLRYEIRKGKYLDEVNSVFIVKLGPATPYRELLQVIRICMQEKIKQYALLKDEFVIVPADPVPEPPAQKSIELIYL